MKKPSRHLVFHGAIALLFGLLLGIPYGHAIHEGASAQVVNSWRVAHQSLPIGAALMFSVAAVLTSLTVSLRTCWIIAIALIITAYAFGTAMPLAAITGHRGLTSTGLVGLSHVVFVGNIAGVIASMVAAVVLLYASFVSLRTN